MKFIKIIYNPISPVLFTIILFIIIFQSEDFRFLNHGTYKVTTPSTQALGVNQKVINEECERIVDSQLERSGYKVDKNKTAIEIVKSNCLWISDSSFTTDFDADDQMEIVMITFGAGCGSCHAQEVRIIKDDKVVFYKEGSDFAITLANEFTGFVLQYPEKSLPPNSGDKYIIEGYKAVMGDEGLESFIGFYKEKKVYIFNG
ncbi:hypothetical protein A2Z10_03000 [Candidatus Azambacteria bacterium RBG_16_47_10]|uniref:Uncharacterized protein n=1 Tax=Candidatus Azambacteria bacterium RBG_16_47_10 TaxID=1797292 RepID=A0A1F5B0P5_9BACT|nr:MAG: hypothetical protein A2Z10_03000 [Candidatus Azambacteria bacterium RBG_16_47_10]